MRTYDPGIRLAMLCLLIGFASGKVSAQPHSPQSHNSHQRKLIEWGWDEPDTQFLREHCAEMQQYPFDGVVFHLSGSGNFTWDAWGGRAFTRAEFQRDIENLQATQFGRLTDNFIRLNVSPGKNDWFDDATWKVILENSSHAAAIAKQTGCKGLLFDTEQYLGEPFNYRSQPPRPIAEYRAQVRKRGREWIRAINHEFPDIVIMLSFGYRTAQPKPGQSPEDAKYALLPDFLDGILEACSEQTVIVDGWEQSYGYRNPEQFAQARHTIREDALNWTAVPEQYRKHMHAAFGIWMDFNLKDHGWHTDDLSMNYFSPAAFQSSVEAALGQSDRYVWIYTEQPRWWTNEKLPGEYVEALKSARESFAKALSKEIPGTKSQTNSKSQ
ncbi:hypothetical protein [Planctomicrobium piriforme]|uniref:Secreted protein n=1 Tax=Planctomicrobium piriforme TaxID=1576369 RepID=A0A1I3E2K1_9PLAN|nr:hypothetical protein [Planctomicrobium piriforme]SFH93204.1 hypothetical protein SAMN05421753_10453 [Planctomicrobium piriforme]